MQILLQQVRDDIYFIFRSIAVDAIMSSVILKNLCQSEARSLMGPISVQI